MSKRVGSPKDAQKRRENENGKDVEAAVADIVELCLQKRDGETSTIKPMKRCHTHTRIGIAIDFLG